jgi:hypothetical protein
LVILSITLSDTPDAAAPRIASTPAAKWPSTVGLAMWSPSPESPAMKPAGIRRAVIV